MLISYQEMYLNSDNQEFIIQKRLEMVRYANENGYATAAKYFCCTRKTVKKWCRRYNLHGIVGLKDLSRRPHNSPNKADLETTIKIKDIAIKAKKEKKYITVNNVRKKSGINSYADKTINKYIKKALGERRNKKRPKTNGGSTEWKKQLKPFQLIQIDIKYLTDIDNLKPYFNDFNNNLAKYQITAVDVATGYPIVAYCDEKSVTYTTMFLENILYPFLNQFPNLNLKNITIQTDNGKEFTNKYTKTKGNEPKETAFTLFILENFKKHKTIIPGHCTAQSDVEHFHWTIERDCLAWEDITNNEELIKETTKYINEYIFKKNLSREYAPVEKIKETMEVKGITFPKPQILIVKSLSDHR